MCSSLPSKKRRALLRIVGVLLFISNGIPSLKTTQNWSTFPLSLERLGSSIFGQCRTALLCASHVPVD
jgi:hypothetical protein